MNSDIRRWTLGGGIALLTAAIAMFALMHYRGVQAEQSEARRIGADWQQRGLLSQQDYVRLRGLGHAVVTTRRLSDADVNWLLATLAQSPSTVAHARILTILSTLDHPSAPQKERIKQAITPLLQSRDVLEQQSAERVQSKLALSR